MTSAYNEHDDYQHLPLAATAIRQYFQLSCTKMAQKLKVSTQCVKRMENGTYRISNEMLHRYSALFGGLLYTKDILNLSDALNKLYNYDTDDKQYIIENDLNDSSVIVVEIFTWAFNQKHCELKDFNL